MTYEQARDRYKELMRRYTDALERKTGNVEQLFDDAERAWSEVATLAPEGTPEAGAGVDAHVLLAFSHAVASGDKDEAQRLYKLMSEEDRNVVDRHDQTTPGSMKIWLTTSQ